MSYFTNDIHGFCPMGCGATLSVGAGGHIRCSNADCPNPDAVDILLQDNETDHIVDSGVAGFSIRHPLRERLDDELMRCKLHHDLAALDGPHGQPGRYRVRRGDEGWVWEPITEPPTPEANDVPR